MTSLGFQLSGWLVSLQGLTSSLLRAGTTKAQAQKISCIIAEVKALAVPVCPRRPQTGNLFTAARSSGRSQPSVYTSNIRTQCSQDLCFSLSTPLRSGAGLYPDPHSSHSSQTKTAFGTKR